MCYIWTDIPVEAGNIFGQGQCESSLSRILNFTWKYTRYLHAFLIHSQRVVCQFDGSHVVIIIDVLRRA